LLFEYRRIRGEQLTPKLELQLDAIARSVPRFKSGYLATIRSALSGDNFALFVAFEDGKPVGFADASIQPFKEKTMGSSGWTIVHPDRRGTVIGGKLFYAKLVWMASKGSSGVTAIAETPEGFKMLKSADFDFELEKPGGGFAGATNAGLTLDGRKRAELLIKAERLFGRSHGMF